MSSKTKTTATKEKATPALVPKLRFPEFREADAWEPTTIGALGRFYYGKSAPKWSLAEDAPTPCVRYGELYTKFGPVITETYSRTNTAPETLRFSKGGEILIPRVGEKPEDFGKCCAYLPLKDIAIGEMISVLETKQHPLFYTYYFRNLYKQFAKVVEGQNVKNLYFSELEPLPIHCPSSPEQQKIAECLSSVDELIAAQARKMDALKTHKKWLMQQLFPREGETQPRLRFPEYQNAGEWASEPLGDFGEIVTGKTPSTKESDLWGGGILFITPTDISEDDKYQHTTARTVVETKSTKILPAGSVVYTCIASIGKMALTVHPSITNQQINAVVPNEKALGEFIYYALANMTPWIKTIPATSTLPIINKTDFSKIMIRHPEEKAEQQRIADCLTNLDDLIAAQTQKLDTLKTHKKGLMQQLFPTPEAVEA
ncbi:MAG: restriction endonuclease subunit S [Thiobacillus sp.]|nr:restriction endonuclease subunit S [Thiobacillus sp.]